MTEKENETKHEKIDTIIELPKEDIKDNVMISFIMRCGNIVRRAFYLDSSDPNSFIVFRDEIMKKITEHGAEWFMFNPDGSQDHCIVIKISQIEGIEILKRD